MIFSVSFQRRYKIYETTKYNKWDYVYVLNRSLEYDLIGQTNFISSKVDLAILQKKIITNIYLKKNI